MNKLQDKRKQLENLIEELPRDIVLQVVFPCTEELLCYTDEEDNCLYH